MKTYDKEEIKDEYNTSATSGEEYQKVKWGSAESMQNRFRLAVQSIDFSKIGNWLDIGSGTGAFQLYIKNRYPDIKATGIDISRQLILYAETREDLRDFNNLRFIQEDFIDFQESEFDLLTSIGVLQKTNIPLNTFFDRAFKCLNDNGILFIDTKNAGWEKFNEPGFFPEKTHSWFDVNDLIHFAAKSGFRDISVKGFVPDVNKVVETHQSHTVFLVAKR